MAAVLPLLAASYSRDPRLISSVAVAGFLPPLLVGLHSGALADRYDRRKLMWRADLARAGVVAALTFLILADRGGIWTLCAVAVVLGGADTIFDNASSALLPMLVRREQLERANAWLQSAQIATQQFIGAPIGGLLFVIAAAVPFGANSLMFALAAVLALGMSRQPDNCTGRDTGAPRASFMQDIREGVWWLWGNSVLKTLALMLAAINAASAAVVSILVLYVLEVLDVGRLGYPAMLVVLAVGSILGGIVVPAATMRLGRACSIRLSVVLMVVALGAVGLSTTFWLAAAAFFVSGAASMMWNVNTISLRQALVPDHLLGRVTSSYRVIGLGVMPLSAALAGVVAHAFSVRTTILGAAVGLTLAAAAAFPFLTKQKLDQGIEAARNNERQQP